MAQPQNPEPSLLTDLSGTLDHASVQDDPPVRAASAQNQQDDPDPAVTEGADEREEGGVEQSPFDFAGYFQTEADGQEEDVEIEEDESDSSVEVPREASTVDEEPIEVRLARAEERQRSEREARERYERELGEIRSERDLLKREVEAKAPPEPAEAPDPFEDEAVRAELNTLAEQGDFVGAVREVIKFFGDQVRSNVMKEVQPFMHQMRMQEAHTAASALVRDELLQAAQTLGEPAKGIIREFVENNASQGTLADALAQRTQHLGSDQEKLRAALTPGAIRGTIAELVAQGKGPAQSQQNPQPSPQNPQPQPKRTTTAAVARPRGKGAKPSPTPNAPKKSSVDKAGDAIVNAPVGGLAGLGFGSN